MLVLSRRTEEKIVFPTLGITIHMLGVKNGQVRIGIEAPPEIPILRGELAGLSQSAGVGNSRHTLMNRLNKVSLALHLLRRQLESGLEAEAFKTLEQAFPAMEALEHELTHRRNNKSATPKVKGKALIVEDDDNERELLAGLLRMNGLDCCTAADGQAALDHLANNERPDLVLLDLKMPRCDGPQTLRRIRDDRRFHGLRVFAVSGSRPQDVGLEVGPNGLDAWFPKPVNPSRLWEAIQNEVPSLHGNN